MFSASQSDHFLIIADPLALVKCQSDTSLSLAEGAIALGKKVYWCEAKDIGFFGSEVVVKNCVEVLSASHVSYEVGASQGLQSLSHFSHVFVRKDPPFDEEYKDLCWLLASQTSSKIINSAESLLTFHEKALQWRLSSEGVLNDHSLIPTCVSDDVDLISQFCLEQQRTAENFLNAPALHSLTKGFSGMQFIVKPWLGHGGYGVELLKKREDVLSYLMLNTGDVPGRTKLKFMVQPFLPEITVEGDRRVLLVNGKMWCDFVRYPAEGKVVSNLAQGASARLVPLSEENTKKMERIALALKEKGIVFAGVDLIGSRVSEINITSPTGVRMYESLKGVKITKNLMEKLLES